jgi:hypothetical protein
MENLLRRSRYALIAILTLAAYAGASAGTLYKSVDKDGRITFSDAPIEGAVTIHRMEMSDSAKPAAGSLPGDGTMYLALGDSFDEAVTKANEKMDLAEHALALARQALGDHDPLSLRNPRHTAAEARQLEFYKRDVVNARRNLMRVLRQRNVFVSFRQPIA